MPHEILRPGALTAELAAQWDALLDQDEDFGSPFFAHEFTRAVGRHRDDLYIAVLRDAGAVTGFLPFHRKAGGCAAPVGGQICDYQGVIGTVAQPGPRGEALLRGCGLSAYDFNHALAAQDLLARNAFDVSHSLRADLRSGFDSWQAEVRAQTKQAAKMDRMRRKIVREQGELRFIAHDRSAEAWLTFIGWKDAALRRQGAGGFPGPGWVGAVLHDIRNIDTPRFAGLFSTLYAGDRLVAAHLGMRSDRAWHWWFPSYDPALQHYAPGLLLMLCCIEEAAKTGLAELDFGRGTQRYKREFGNRARVLCEGSLERQATLPGAARALRKSAQLLANRLMPESKSALFRRAGTKLLRAGLI